MRIWRKRCADVALCPLTRQIRPSLPPRLRIARTWTLLYSLDQHGTSVSTLYSRVHAGARATEAACLVLVRDDRGHRFGAFVNEPLRRSDSFYGSGESFLYREERFAADDFRIGGACRTYGWTGRNTYCALTDDTALAFGGGCVRLAADELTGQRRPLRAVDRRRRHGPRRQRAVSNV